MKRGREANLWQRLVKSSKEFAISSLNSGLERGTYKVLCQRTQSKDGTQASIYGIQCVNHRRGME